jgi:glucose-6-phosphate 1-dehydrogenase
MAVAEHSENPLVEGLERLPVHPTTLVIFGGTGDLAQRKLLPAIYNLAPRGRAAGALQPDRGLARRHAARRLPEMARESIEQYSRRQPDEQVLDRLLEQVRYVPGTFDDDSSTSTSARRSTSSTRTRTSLQPRLLPRRRRRTFFPLIVGKLGEHGLDGTRARTCAW